jgi:hypothetical protein
MRGRAHLAARDRRRDLLQRLRRARKPARVRLEPLARKLHAAPELVRGAREPRRPWLQAPPPPELAGREVAGGLDVAGARAERCDELRRALRDASRACSACEHRCHAVQWREAELFQACQKCARVAGRELNHHLLLQEDEHLALALRERCLAQLLKAVPDLGKRARLAAGLSSDAALCRVALKKASHACAIRQRSYGPVLLIQHPHWAGVRLGLIGQQQHLRASVRGLQRRLQPRVECGACGRAAQRERWIEVVLRRGCVVGSGAADHCVQRLLRVPACQNAFLTAFEEA